MDEEREDLIGSTEVAADTAPEGFDGESAPERFGIDGQPDVYERETEAAGQPGIDEQPEVLQAADAQPRAARPETAAAETLNIPQHKGGAGAYREKIAELQLEIEVLKAELENGRREREEYLALAQRTKADFDNFKKRNADSSQRLREDGVSDGILKVLPVYDAVVKASSMIKDESTLKGLKMILQQFRETLQSTGVEVMESLGQDFNPDFHNAVMNEEAESEELRGKVTEVFQEGFTINGRVLRYAMVKVAI